MADDSSTTGMKVARPDFYVGGRKSDELMAGLMRLAVVERTSGLYRCEARFGNWGTVNNTTGFLFFDRRTFDFGKDIEVKIGDRALFSGKITALEAVFPEGKSAEMTVLAEDRFQDLRMTRRTRTFADVSDSDVFNQIASDHGLSPSVSLSGPTYKVLAQVNQSDLAFLRERARTLGAELWMEGSTLNAKARADRGGPTLSMTHGNQLRDFTVTADLAHQRTGVSVGGWDVSGKSALKYEAEESAVASELNGDTSGASVLKSAFGQRKESVAHAVPLNSAEAQAAAESAYRARARRFVAGRGVADANPDLRVGSYAQLGGLGPLFDGKYYVTEVTHLFDSAKGIRTEFSAERPGIGRAA